MKILHFVGRQLPSKGGNLNELLNTMRDVHVTVPIRDPLHLAKELLFPTSQICSHDTDNEWHAPSQFHFVEISHGHDASPH
jgi:hypothetical protein